MPDDGEIRDGLTQEVAWEVRLRKRKASCAKSMIVTAGRVPGQGRGGEAAPALGNQLAILGVCGPGGYS